MHYGSQSIDGFLSAVASSNVTPAGGTAAAVVGATGAALCEMVCIHTDAALNDAGDDLRRQRRRLLTLADADADAVADLLETGSETETKRAVGVPLAIAEGCLVVVDHAPTVVERGNPHAVPDAVTGVYLARGALQGCLHTVRTNLTTVDDPAFVEEMTDRAAGVEASADHAFEAMLSE